MFWINQRTCFNLYKAINDNSVIQLPAMDG